MSENIGREDVAQALRANIIAPQSVSAHFGRPQFFVPRYAAKVSRVIGKLRVNDFGKKTAATIDDGMGNPTFAELLILDRLRRTDWNCVWISTYGKLRHIASWTSDLRQPTTEALPHSVAELVTTIADLRQKQTGSIKPSFAGCTDIVAWRDTERLMIECKWAKRDRVGPKQEQWLHCAVMADVKIPNWVFSNGLLAASCGASTGCPRIDRGG